ncbi:ABC transporter permease [Nocardia higoensis]|uniref:ABC transporter permease n=1 Tax=Nocardia higoensis TaxID=228599 RepID=UPI0002E5B6C6|nr:ABC transporter permease subunit [Nocardia higoensis]
MSVEVAAGRPALVVPDRTTASLAPARVRRRWVTASAAWFCLVLSVLPIVITAVVAVTRYWNNGPFSGGLTTQWMGDALTSFLPALSASAQVAAFTLLIGLPLGLPLAFLFARGGLPGAAVIRWMTSLPLAVPGIAVGLALGAMYPQLQRSGWLLILGHVVVTMPFLVAALAPVLRDPELRQLEQTAATLGAGAIRRLATVTVPHVRPALIAAALMVLALSFGEFNLTYFIVNPAQQTLPVVLFGAFIYGQTSAGAALALWYCIAVIPLAVGLHLFGTITVRRHK